MSAKHCAVLLDYSGYARAKKGKEERKESKMCTLKD